MFKDKKTIYMGSIGMNLSDISIEVLKIFKKADIVISDALNEVDLAYFKKINKNTFSINKHLSTDIEKSVNYIFDKINRLFKKFDTILYLTHGNPLYLNKRNQSLYEILKKKFNIKTIPSVSSLDYVIDLICRKLKGENTYVIYTYPVENRLNPYNDIIIFNPNLIKNIDNKKIKTLTRLYKPDHKFYTIKINTVFEKERIKSHNISSFKDEIKEIDDRTTIYIPSVRKIKIKSNR